MNPLEATTRRLAAAAPTLRAIPNDDLLAAWNHTLAAFLDPTSPERRQLDPDLLQATGLSPAGLDRGLRTIGAGMAGEPAATALHRAPKQQQDGFSLVVLPANPPGLMLQSLLPALAARAPVLFKSSRAEPFFAPAFLDALAHRLPILREACATATWTGGDASIEARLYAGARLVVAYGNESTIASITAAGPRRLVTFGPKLSLGWVGAKADLGWVGAKADLGWVGAKADLGWVGAKADLEQAARGMALDIALFDQRGCLSVEAMLVDHTAVDAFARILADALAQLAIELPPGRASAAERAGVRLAREEADLRGLTWSGEALDTGTVIVENDVRISPSPGLRTVRIHPIEGIPTLHEWNGRLQGIAVAGHLPAAVRRAFEQAGVSRFAPAGELQATDAAWRNAGIDLAAEFAGSHNREAELARPGRPARALRRGLPASG